MSYARTAALALAVFFSVGMPLRAPAAENAGGAPEARPASASSQVRVGTVEETMSGRGFTYVRVNHDGTSFWVAGPRTSVSVGDEVTLPPGTIMTGFHSRAFDRTFERIEFVPFIGTGRAGPITGAMPQDDTHAGLRGDQGGAGVEVGDIPKAEGGMTVAEVNAGAAELAGREVTVRGRVVRFRAAILGKNWLHIRDGSGDAESRTDDMAVTTDGPARVGDIVLVRGTVGTDRDFGAGYRYRVIIENAQLTKE